MSKFFGEFKKFITRGNVIDMAVGVIVGSSFTAIVNALSNNILKPLINWVLALIIGDGTLSEAYTFLNKVMVLDEAGLETGEIDLTKSIYIDWGAFINAIINFFIVAFVLFLIVRFINKVRERNSELRERAKDLTLSGEEKRMLKQAGIKTRDKAAVKAYFDEMERIAAEKKKAEEEAAAEKARIERENNPPAEVLLKEIRDLLRAKQ